LVPRDKIRGEEGTDAENPVSFWRRANRNSRKNRLPPTETKGDHVFLERREQNETEPSGFKVLTTVVPLKKRIGTGLLKTIMHEVEVSDEDLAKIMQW
jgi:hypothetical protein